MSKRVLNNYKRNRLFVNQFFLFVIFLTSIVMFVYTHEFTGILQNPFFSPDSFVMISLVHILASLILILGFRQAYQMIIKYESHVDYHIKSTKQQLEDLECRLDGIVQQCEAQNQK